MKLSLLTIAILFFSTAGSQNKHDLLCHKWKQTGLKLYGKTYQPVADMMAEIIEFKNDGSYDEVLYGQLKIKGQWKLNADSTMLGFSVTEMNGQNTPNMTIDQIPANQPIVKLTADTLIYGTIKYVGPDKSPNVTICTL